MFITVFHIYFKTVNILNAQKVKNVSIIWKTS